MEFPNEYIPASARRAPSSLVSFVLLVFVVLYNVASVTPAQAQVTTVTCTGATTATNISHIRVDIAAQTCTMGDGVGSTPPTTGSMRFVTRPDQDPDGVFAQVRRPGNDNDLLTALTQCDMPGGITTAGRCRHEGNPVASGTGTYANNLGTTLVTLTTTYTAVLNAITIVNASVTFGTPAAGPTAQDKSNTVAGLQNTFNSATPGLLDNLPINGAGGTGNGNGNGITFAPSGLGFARSHLDSANPFDRDYGPAFAAKGYFDGGQKVRHGNGFNFSVDLNRLASSSGAAGQAGARGAANGHANLTSSSSLTSSSRDLFPGSNPLSHLAERPMGPGNEPRGDSRILGLGTGGSLSSGSPKGGRTRKNHPQSRITPFIKGEYVDFDDGETNADRDGQLWVVTSGLGYRVSQSTTIGLLSRYRTGEADSNALNATLDSDFWGGGAYLTTTIGGGLNVAIAGLYETGDNDIRIGSATGSFDSEHVTLEGRINKRLERGTWWFEPGVGIRYVDTDQDNYTDSSGTLVTNQDLTLGRLTYGPKIGTAIHRSNATIKPYAKFGGVWDFENDGNFTTSTAGTFTNTDHGLNLGGGLEVTYLNGLSLRLQGDWTTYDTDLEVWSISGGIGAPLSALGLGQVGLVSLDLAASAQDASAQARLRIPLGGRE